MRVAEKIASFPLAAVMMVKESVNRGRRDDARRRTPLRAAAVPRALRHRGPEGRHGGLPREAVAAIPRALKRAPGGRHISLTEPAAAPIGRANSRGPSAAFVVCRLAGPRERHGRQASCTGYRNGHGKHTFGQEGCAQDRAQDRSQQGAAHAHAQLHPQGRGGDRLRRQRAPRARRCSEAQPQIMKAAAEGHRPPQHRVAESVAPGAPGRSARLRIAAARAARPLPAPVRVSSRDKQEFTHSGSVRTAPPSMPVLRLALSRLASEAAN